MSQASSLVPLAVPGARSAGKLDGFDVMRVLAAIAVIWIHTPNSEKLIPLADLGRFAVPFFATSAVFFAALSGMKATSRTLGAYGLDRIRRLYLPMLAWSAIYLLVVNTKYFAGMRDEVMMPSFSMLLHGATIHLWFIPFLMVASIIAYGFGKILVGYTPQGRRNWAMLFVLTGLLTATTVPPESVLDVRVVGSAWFTLPGVFWGLAFVSVYTPAMLPALQHPVFMIAATGLLMLGALNLFTPDFNWAMVNLSGVGAFLVGFGLTHPRVTASARPLSPLTYGVYLCHGLVLGAIGTIMFSILKYEHTPPTDLAVFALAVPISFWMTHLMRRWRATAWLMP